MFFPERTVLWRRLLDKYRNVSSNYRYDIHELDIVKRLPDHMRDQSHFLTPYTCSKFSYDKSSSEGTADTQREHIVARKQAHVSGLGWARVGKKCRGEFSNDPLNFTVAREDVNQSGSFEWEGSEKKGKSDKDAAKWQPPLNSAWFASRVIRVKHKYGLSIDPAEEAALKELLSKEEQEELLELLSKEATLDEADFPVSCPQQITHAE